MTRRLAAIFSADVVGFNRLMGVDEAVNPRRPKSLRKELVQPTSTGHNGRIVKLTGDGLRPTHKASYWGELGGRYRIGK